MSTTSRLALTRVRWILLSSRLLFVIVFVACRRLRRRVVQLVAHFGGRIYPRVVFLDVNNQGTVTGLWITSSTARISCVEIPFLDGRRKSDVNFEIPTQ